MVIIREIVCTIADHEAVDPVNLDPPLGAVVNTDLIEAVAADSRHSETMVSSPLEFEYHGYTVTVDSAGEVDVSESAKAPDNQPETEASGSPKARIDETTRKRAMKNATDIIAARERPFADRLDGLLQVVRNTLDLDAATLSYVDDSSYVFEAVDVTETIDIQAGDIVPVAETACKRVVETEQALTLRDVAEEAPELANLTPAVATYLGVPVFVDGDMYGTFCFYDEEPRAEEFTEWELAFVELLSNWVNSELERRQREWDLWKRSAERPHSTS